MPRGRPTHCTVETDFRLSRKLTEQLHRRCEGIMQKIEAGDIQASEPLTRLILGIVDKFERQNQQELLYTQGVETRRMTRPPPFRVAAQK